MSAYDTKEDNRRLLEAMQVHEARKREARHKQIFLESMAQITQGMIQRQSVVRKNARAATGKPAA